MMTGSRVQKRKAIQKPDQSIKKARHTEGNVADSLLVLEAGTFQDATTSTIPHPSDSETGDRSNTSSEDDSDRDITIDTPLTPSSPKASSRFPSELKTHHCTYPNCGKAFNRPAKLSQHLLSHTNSRPFVCPRKPCTKDFLRQSHLKHHIKSAHSDVRDYVCDWEGCGKSFITATRLKRHRAAHEGREKHKCVTFGCGQTFRKHGTLQRHVLTVHEGRKAYQCELKAEDGTVCAQGFDTLGKLQAHGGRVHGGKRFWCSMCTSDATMEYSSEDQPAYENFAAFSTYAKLQEHIKIEHPPTCDMCSLVCNSQRDLKRHIEVRHENSGLDDRKTHICPEPDCSRAFTKKGNLNVHIQSAHKAKKYVCGRLDLETLNRIEGWDGLNACGKGLSTKGSLENHIRTVHMGLGIRRLKSTKKSRSNSARRQHGLDMNLMKLTGVGYEEYSGRQIACVIPDCDFRFSRSYDLQIHLESRHGLSEDQATASVIDAGKIPEHLGDGHDHGGLSDDLMHDSDPNALQTMLPQAHSSIYEEDIIHGGPFWVGDDPGQGAREGHDEWFREQMEMQRLIDGDDSLLQGQNEAAAMIDPVLR